MDAPQFNGDDNRDTLAPDPEAEERCPDCGVHVSEPCEKTCGCSECRRREFAKQDAEPKDAA